jgi:hypothetical protein
MIIIIIVYKNTKNIILRERAIERERERKKNKIKIKNYIYSLHSIL